MRSLNLRGRFAVCILSIRRRIQIRRLDRALFAKRNESKIAYVIIMPNAVHLGLLALQHLRSINGNPVAICNGLSQQERAILHNSGFDSSVHSTIQLKHSVIIDSLLRILKTPFWLVDHDCYILQMNVLLQCAKIQQKESCGFAYFYSQNPVDRKIVPETFLLYLDPKVIRGIATYYGVSSKFYYLSELPKRVRRKFTSEGLSSTYLPETHKDYFDTLKLIAVLADLDGKGFHYGPRSSAVCEIDDQVMHIGNTSRPEWTIEPGFYKAIGAYFWKLSLSTSPLAEIASYQILAGRLPSIADMEKILRDSGCPDALLRGLVSIIAGVAPR